MIMMAGFDIVTVKCAFHCSQEASSSILSASVEISHVTTALLTEKVLIKVSSNRKSSHKICVVLIKFSYVLTRLKKQPFTTLRIGVGKPFQSTCTFMESCMTSKKSSSSTVLCTRLKAISYLMASDTGKLQILATCWGNYIVINVLLTTFVRKALSKPRQPSFESNFGHNFASDRARESLKGSEVFFSSNFLKNKSVKLALGVSLQVPIRSLRDVTLSQKIPTANFLNFSSSVEHENRHLLMPLLQ